MIARMIYVASTFPPGGLRFCACYPPGAMESMSSLPALKELPYLPMAGPMDQMGQLDLHLWGIILTGPFTEIL